MADVIEKLISTPIVFNAEVSEQIFPEFRDAASQCTQPVPIYRNIAIAEIARCAENTRGRASVPSLFIESGTGGLIKYQVTKAQHKASQGRDAATYVGREGGGGLLSLLLFQRLAGAEEE